MPFFIGSGASSTILVNFDGFLMLNNHWMWEIIFHGLKVLKHHFLQRYGCRFVYVQFFNSISYIPLVRFIKSTLWDLLIEHKRFLIILLKLHFELRTIIGISIFTRIFFVRIFFIGKRYFDFRSRTFKGLISISWALV